MHWRPGQDSQSMFRRTRPMLPHSYMIHRSGICLKSFKTRNRSTFSIRPKGSSESPGALNTNANLPLYRRPRVCRPEEWMARRLQMPIGLRYGMCEDHGFPNTCLKVGKAQSLVRPLCQASQPGSSLQTCRNGVGRSRHTLGFLLQWDAGAARRPA